MTTVQHLQDTHNVELGVMDTALGTSQHPNDMDPSFISCATLPTDVSSQLIQEPPSAFPAMADQCVLLPTSIPLPDVFSSAAFLGTMEVNPSPPLVQPVASEFTADVSADPFTTVSPIDNVMNIELAADSHTLSVSSPTQIPSPVTPSLSVSAALSPGSVLDQPVTTVRANTSVSPVPISPAYIPAPPPATNLMFLPQDVAVPKQSEVSPHAEAESVVAVETMLQDIEQTAKQARVILHQRHDLAMGSSINILNERISQVTQKFAGLLSISSALASSSPYGAPIQPPNPNVPEPEDILHIYGSNVAPSIPPPIDVPLSDHLSALDHTRKRCASEMDEQRSVKAPKREPQEDAPLNAPFVRVPPAVTTPPFTIAGIPHTVSLATSQTVPSRPPTPPVTFSAHGPFGVVRPGPANGAAFPSYSPAGDISSSATTPIPSVSPTFPVLHSSWSEPTVHTRHQHSMSVGSGLPQTPPIGTNNMVDPFTTQPLQAVSPAIGRMSRSGSTSGAYSEVLNFGLTEASGGGWLPNGRPSSMSSRFAVVGEAVSPGSSSASDRAPLSTAHNSPAEEDEDDDDDDEDDEVKINLHHSSDSPPAASDIPQEYRAEVDRIFFEYLNKICSNLDATDLKGEPIHQTLMAKKMQRLDESPDFRPFKFRIQAFTMGFLEELARSGYSEEKIPMKKVRNYLWRQQYILRFNEDGKKAKSKGNHIWNIEARKVGDGKWEFRPFYRKLAGAPPSVAYRGLRWTWSPRVWDPQASWQNVPVEYSSPSLPPWLSWNDDALSGTPTADSESCRITVIAKFVLDGQEGQLSHTFPLTVAAAKSIEAAPYPRSRRPSLGGESSRLKNEPVVFHEVQRVKPRPLPARRNSPEHPDTRVIRVLKSVAQRVAAEAHTQIVSTSPPKQSEFQSLVKQQEVVEHSVDAYDKAISHANGPQPSRLLAVAAQNVVVQAAHTVIADRTAAIGGTPQQQSETVAIKSVTVTELTDATQGAIAAAVKQQGKDSNEVDIMVAATSILKTRTAIVDASSSTTQQPHTLPTGVAPHLIPMGHQGYSLSSVPEYV